MLWLLWNTANKVIDFAYIIQIFYSKACLLIIPLKVKYIIGLNTWPLKYLNGLREKRSNKKFQNI